MDWLEALGITTVNIIIVVMILLNLDKIKIAISIILSPIRGIHRVQKFSDAIRYEGVINQYCSRIAPDFFDKSLSVKFTSIDSLLKDASTSSSEKVITVFIDREKKPSAAIIDAVKGYVSNNLYPNIANSVDQEFTDANHLFICGKILNEFRDSSINVTYSENVFKPKATDRVKSYLSEINSLDHKYYYYQIFLNAVKQVDGQLLSSIYDVEIKNEIDSFFQYLLSISLKERGEDVDLTFAGKYFKYSVILVAKDETFSAWGLEVFISRVKKCFKVPVNRIFLTALGKRNVANLKQLAYRLGHMRGIEIFSESDYSFYRDDGRVYPLIILVIDRTSDDIIDEIKGDYDDVLLILKAHIPEIEEGKVNVDSIARTPGYSCKILVSTHDTRLNLIGCCIGPQQQRKQAISEALGNEQIKFIENSDDPKVLISQALPISPKHIKEIRISSRIKKAQVFIDDDKTGIAIGEEGRNVKIAEKLIGWRLKIERSSKLNPKTLNKRLQ